MPTPIMLVLNLFMMSHMFMKISIRCLSDFDLWFSSIMWVKLIKGPFNLSLAVIIRRFFII